MQEELELHHTIPLKQKLLQKWLWIYFFAFLGAPAWYLIKVLVSQSLSVEEVGILYSILGLLSILSNYNDLWLTDALQYYLPQYIIDKKYNEVKTLLISTWIVQFLTWIVIGWILFVWSPRLAQNYFHHPLATQSLQLFCLYFLMINLFQVIQSIFIAMQQVQYSSGLENLRIWAILWCIALFWQFWTLSSLSFVMSWLIWLSCTLIVAIYFFIKKYWRILWNYIFSRNGSLFRQQRNYAIWILLWANITGLLGQVDQQIIIVTLWPLYAGYWTNYISLFTAVSIFTAPLLGYLFPLFTELVTKKSYWSIRLLLRYCYSWAIIYSLIVGIIWYLYGPMLATFFFWSAFRFSWELFSYGIVWYIFSLLTILHFQLIWAYWLVKKRTLILWIALIVNISLNFWLIWIYGIYVAVFATIISNCIMAVRSGIVVYNQQQKMSI